ncbi:hypothetical protein SEVIR_2G150100v4 [Setaria viridis]|nr:uncharacterized protein LOC117846108 isoform X1 [Setaria viridis]XP_034583109.1 uncharacterized protein LOC117846108 isoform X1 [Setaria viridis]XP_034583111.1 uncharacterized protein LOC117846108 isoform X1 [Setaria viridis]
MAPKRGRARKGDRRIDAAIDHFAPMGYTARQVRTAVNALLKEYLGAAAWPFLEDSSYLVVQEKLLEMEDEEKKAPPTLEQEIQEEEQPEQEQPQVEHGCSYYEKSSGPVSMQQESAVDEVRPQSNRSILEGHSAVPAGIELSDEEVEDPMLIEPHAIRSGGETRRPCHGWLTESEDEEEQTSEQHELHLPESRRRLDLQKKVA